MKQGRGDKQMLIQEVLDSYCQVCFVAFNKIAPRKIDQGEQICYCIKCNCRVHKCCYDIQVNSSFITTKLREFICQRCEKKQLIDKGCTICHRKEGALKIIGNQAIHVFCGLMHKDINVTGYFPQITFKKSENYKDVRNVCGLCSKPNATEQCTSQSCFKRFHGYCIWLNLKSKQIQEEDPQCEKYYLSSGDNGKFDLSEQLMPKLWLYQQFDRVLLTFEQHGFKIDDKEKQNIKNSVYENYQKDQKEEKDYSKLKRGGFSYILCKDHESSFYCNCFNHGSGDMVQCQCCFQWYHQKCVNYQPIESQEHYICNYCTNFYDLKKKIIDEVKSSKIEHYQLKFEPPKLHLNDFIWLMRVIDHRIAGGAASKMIKELAKYPLKTSKMDIMLRNQNKKKISNISEIFIQKYLQSKQHETLLKPKPVLGLDYDQKPIVLQKNVQYNKKLKNYVDFIQNYVRKNNLPDSFANIIHELRFKQRAVDGNYQTVLQLSKSQCGYSQIPILKMKVQEFSFMEVIREIDSGTMIEFQDLENAIEKAKNSSNVPIYLLKPLTQRYERVKNLIQFISTEIKEKKQTSAEVENSIKKLKDEKVAAPQIYRNFHEEKKFIKELYLFYLRQEGKPLQQSATTSDKIQILLKEEACKPNREIVECVNSLHIEGTPVHEDISLIIEKYTKLCVIFQFKNYLRKKSIKLSTLESLYSKSEKLSLTDTEVDISNLILTWKKIREIWIHSKKSLEGAVDKLYDIDGLTTQLKNIQETIQYLSNFSLEIIDKTQEVPELGSVYRLQQLRTWVDTLIILCTESQLKKNPLTLLKLPEGLPRQNLLVKQYLILKKEYNELMIKYNTIYTRINEKIEILKNDLKKPRKQQIKENLEKPRLTDVTNFIDVLKQSKVNMDLQIKQLTKSVNKTIQIGSKVNKFLQTEKHNESMLKEDQIDLVRKQIDQLRKRVLIEAQLSLENELKDLYIAEICIRMQKMILTPNAQLDKISKLLKFAEEEGLHNLQTYKRLKSKFEIGNQSSKQINLTKKHQMYLNSESSKLKQSDFFYSSLVAARKSLPLSIPQSLKQKNKHYDDLLNRNQYLRKKIQFILNEQPKKYDIEDAKITYLQALKHPFELDGLNKLIIQFEKVQELLHLWQQNKELDDSNDKIFIMYDNIVFHIEEIEILKKSIQDSENIIHKIRTMRKTDLSLQSMCKVEQNLQIMEQNNISSKNSKIYNKFKIQYYLFWIKLLQKFREQQVETISFSKIKSILMDIYTTIQRNIKNHINSDELKPIVDFLQDIMISIRNNFQEKGQNIQQVYEGFIDIEELKYEIQSGLDIKDQTKILNPFNDLNRFYSVDLQRMHSRQQQDFLGYRRLRVQALDMQDPFMKESKSEKSHKSIMEVSESRVDEDDFGERKVEEWEKNQGSIVSEAQRNKAKQLLLKNIKKNPQFTNYENLSQQVKMIQNQLFGDYHNQVYKYFEQVNCLQKLFIKLLNCPNISIRVKSKKFQWDFFKLLIPNMQKINQIQQILIQKNKQTGRNIIPIQKKIIIEKREDKDKDNNNIVKKQNKDSMKNRERTIEEMIASGKIDDDIRNEMKKQIKAIKDKNKKKKHKYNRKRSRSRSRSRSHSSSKSPQAKFSSDSQENKLPGFIEKQYNQTVDKHYLNDIYIPNITSNAPLLYDPELEDENLENQKKNFPKGAILQLRSMDLQIILKNKIKTVLKTFLMTTQQYSKISIQIVDPGISSLQLKKYKDQQQIIQYLNKPTIKKYKFLVGWFEADDRQTTQLIKEFAIECSQRKKIYGFQNDGIRIHFMSIHQYVRILQLHEPPNKVSSQMAAEILKKQRLIYIIQYPSEKMYELKGIYENFNNVEAKESSYDVDIPEIVANATPVDKNAVYGHNPYGMNFNPLIPSQPIKTVDINPLKPVEYEGWVTSETSSSTTYPIPPSYPAQSFNPLNSLTRFSPIMTDEEDNNGNIENKQKTESHEKQIDLASNILNSLVDVNIKQAQVPLISRNYQHQSHPVEQPVRFQPFNRYQPMNNPPQPISSMIHHQRWQSQGMMPPPQIQMNRINMPYNPMITSKFASPHNPPSMMYRNNPMMSINPPPYAIPPPGQSSQPKPPGSQPYDQYLYQRQ